MRRISVTQAVASHAAVLCRRLRRSTARVVLTDAGRGDADPRCALSYYAEAPPCGLDKVQVMGQLRLVLAGKEVRGGARQ